MEKRNMKSKLKTMVLILFGAVLIIWVAFYFSTSRQIRISTQKSMQQVSTHIINALEDEFFAMENLAFSLSRNAKVKEFAAEKDALSFHKKSAPVGELIDTLMQPSGIIDNLIIYNCDHVYYRFRGSLGNTSLQRIADLVKQQALQQHLLVNLEGTQYLCYTSGIYESNEQIGFIVMLMNESKLRNIFIQYNALDDLEIVLAANGKVVVANTPSFAGQSVDPIKETANSFLGRRIGFTPFEIVVSSTGRYSDTLRNHFALAVAITSILFIFVLASFALFWNRYFVKPLFSVAQDIERLGTGEAESIHLTNEPYFDMLVDKLNSMLTRLKEKSTQLLDTQFELQNAEIEKHRTILLSLKKQINMHFIVNVLNTIRALARKNEMTKTVEICEGLSFLLRYTNSPEEWIGGLEEFFVLKQYIQIMQIRYINKFSVLFEIDEGLGDIQIPRMLVQPIIENAILHGFQYYDGDGRLKVTAAIQNGEIVIEVSDNGRGMDAQQLLELRNKIKMAPCTPWNDKGIENVALVNIQKRVHAYFGVSFGLIVESKPGEGTKVVLNLPADPKEK